MEIEKVSNPKFNELDQYLNQLVKSKQFPNFISIIYQNDKIVYSEKAGYSDLERGKEIEFDDNFRIQSMTKPIVSTAAMILYEEGKFTLEDPISKFLPKAKNLKVLVQGENGETKLEDLKKPVSMLDLLTHTGGFMYSFVDPNSQLHHSYSKIFDNEDKYLDKSNRELVDSILELPLYYQPGEYWVYSRSTDIIGHILEIITGSTLDVVLEELIFSKLGMSSTGFYMKPDKIDKLVKLYKFDDSGEFMEHLGDDRYRQKPGYMGGGGGLVSNIGDYLKFSLMIIQGGILNGIRLLTEESVELMMQDQVLCKGIKFPEIFGKGFGYGIGFGVNMANGHIRWGGAYSTTFWIDSKNHIIGIFLSQLIPKDYSVPHRDEIPRLVYQSLGLDL